MLSIQKNLGHDERFFDLLEASAQRADTSVHHLIALLERLEQNDSPRNLEEFVRSRRKYLQENVAGLDARRTRSSQRTMF